MREVWIAQMCVADWKSWTPIMARCGRNSSTGTEDYFKFINRTKIPFARVLKNISEAAKARPIVIQSLFLKIYGIGPSNDEITAYCQRLREIGNIKLVQVYTVARNAMTTVEGVPAWQFVSALSNAEVDAITERVRKEAGTTAKSFYGS